MNIALEIYQYLQAHAADLSQLVLQIIGLASIIVRITPSLKDDDALKNVIRFVGKYIALNRK